MTFTAEEKQQCAERELQMRIRVYPSLVAKDRMTLQQSLREIALMAEVAEDYRTLAEKERP